MINKMTKIAALYLPLLLAASASAYEGSSTEWLAFRGGAVGMFGGGGEVFTGGASWNPSYGLSETFKLRGDLGFSVPKDTFDRMFLSFHYGVLLGYGLGESWEIEVGGGGQAWLGKSLAIYAGANIHRLFSDKLFGLFDRAFIGGSNAFRAVSVIEVRAGLGLTL